MIFLIIIIAFVVIPLIFLIARKARINSFTEEEKEILKSSKEKIKNLKKKLDLIPKVGIAIYIFMVILYIVFWRVFGSMVPCSNNSKNSVFAVSIEDIEFDGIRVNTNIEYFYSMFFTMNIWYILVYVIIRIITYVKFMKEISKSEELSEREKELLKRYYGGRTIPIIYFGFIIQCVNWTLRFILSVRVDKPIIYLYPEKEEKIKVKLSNKEKLLHTYPKYEDEWNVIASPSGILTDRDSKEYYALYYESNYKCKLDKNVGFCVKGEDTIPFLEEKLEKLGLNAREREEFIVYWLPQMEKNAYNYVYFKIGQEVEDVMGIEITPKPDSLIRILMCFKPLNKKIDVLEQKIVTPERAGFTVVEWGGSKIL